MTKTVDSAAKPSNATRVQYVTPQVTDLGPWKKMTLIYSLPIGPGTRGGSIVGGFIGNVGGNNNDA